MAKNNMTFSASLRLNSVQFKKGVADVQRSIKSLQSSFMSLAGALGLGLSINRLGSSLLDTATKLSTAKNVLQNVSKEFGEYGENLEWLRKISNDYGQDLITLTNSFAQFRAAAESSNLTLEQMRKIYESLTKAAGAFHLSADRTNDMMMAVTQMLSKGKVASEELRRQLGNVLPGAFNLMAQAAYNAGVITENSTAALEDAMKKGKVMAEDVLPSFAKELNKVTENADFDSLQSSVNRLKNTWTELVEAGNFENLYKGIIDGAQQVLKYMTSNFWPKILAGMAGVFGGTAVKNQFKKFITGAKEMRAAAIVEFNQVYKAADLLDDKIGKIYDSRKYGNQGISKHFMKSTNPNIKGGLAFLEVNEKQLRNLGFADTQIQTLKKHTLEFNDSIVKLNQAAKIGGGKPLFSSKDEARIVAYNKSVREAAAETERANSAFGRFNKDGQLAGAIFSKLGMAAKTALSMISSALASIAMGALIGGITYLIAKFVEARKEANRIKNIVSDMEESIAKAGGEENKSLIALTRIKRAWEQINDEADDKTKISLINQTNEALGRTGDQLLTIEDDINTKIIPAIDEYIDRIKYAAKQQAILALVQEKTSRVIQLQAENAAITEDKNYGKTGSTYVSQGSQFGAIGTYVTGLTTQAQKLQNQINKNNKEIDEINKGIDKILKQADEDTLAAIYGGRDTVTSGKTGGGGDSGGTKDKDTPQAALNKYKEELQKLENQYKAGAILASEYKNKVDELNQKSFEELSSFGWENAMKGLKNSGDKALAEQLKKLATAKLLEGLDDPEEIEEFDRALQEEADKAYEKFRDAWNKFLEYRKKKPLIGDVDTSDSYMYSRKRKRGQSYSEYETHFNDEYLKVYEKYVDDLTSYKEDLQTALKDMTDPTSIKRMNELLAETITKLQLAGVVVKDLKTKANIAELERDIEDLKKEGVEGLYTSFTSLSDGMDRLYRAFQSIQQINDKTWQSEELENFLTRLNALIQAFEVIKSIVQAITTVTEVYGKIKEKETAKAIALNAAEAASETAKASAAGKAAAAGAASSTASIPIVGPALAIAAVAAVTAQVLRGMKKFATGGFVGGHSYTGDRQLARVNSGEMILNPGQQRNLLDLANGKVGAGGGQVNFKIRGTDLIGVMENEMRRRKG